MTKYERVDMLRGASFAICFFGVSRLIQSVGWMPQDESWLIAGCAAVVVVNFIPPLPKDWFSSLRQSVLIILGAYVFGLKVPWLFVGFLDYGTAAVLCFIVYFTLCIVWIKRLTSREAIIDSAKDNDSGLQ